jgi:hypothetical protein
MCTYSLTCWTVYKVYLWILRIMRRRTKTLLIFTDFTWVMFLIYHYLSNTETVFIFHDGNSQKNLSWILWSNCCITRALIPKSPKSIFMENRSLWWPILSLRRISHLSLWGNHDLFELRQFSFWSLEVMDDNWEASHVSGW